MIVLLGAAKQSYTVFYVVRNVVSHNGIVLSFLFFTRFIYPDRIRYNLRFDVLILPRKYSLPTFYRKSHFQECLHEHLLEKYRLSLIGLRRDQYLL